MAGHLWHPLVRLFAFFAVILAAATSGAIADADQPSATGKIKMRGDESILKVYAGLIDEFDPNFNIVTP